MPKAIENLLDNITLALELDNPAASIRMLVDINLPLEAKRRAAHQLLKSILSLDLTESEKAEIKSVISKTKGIFNNKKGILARLDTMSSLKRECVDAIGKANCLFVTGSANMSFGLIHPVTAISIEDGKGEHKVVANELSGELSLSIYTVYEAIRFVLKGYGLGQRGYHVLDNYGITVQVGRLNHVYDGTSLCLAAACAIISSLFGIPVPSKAAFTGAIDILGETEAVGGINEKLMIAGLKEIDVVYVPKNNMKAIKDIMNLMKTKVIPVKGLTELFDHIFGREGMLSFVEMLNNRKGEEIKGHTYIKPKTKERLLISTVGMRDPYGRSYQVEGDSEFAEGPILTSYRSLSPDIVVLLATRETIKNAERTKAEIERITGKDICHIRTIDIADPTDYDSIYIAILAALISIEDLMKDKETYVSISSGTPQMHAVFIELLRSKRLIAHPLQVREPRFATSWEDRIRPIRSEYLGLGV